MLISKTGKKLYAIASKVFKPEYNFTSDNNKKSFYKPGAFEL